MQQRTMPRNRDIRGAVTSLHWLTTGREVVARCRRSCFHTTAAPNTDGVFRGLTDSRYPVPWIEAWRLQQQGKSALGAEESPKIRDLSDKKMSDSYHRVVLPLGQDPWLSDAYINSSGHIRLGALFMDLDALSGIIVYKHTGPGVTTVTAALDRITIAHPLTEICDLEYSGQVTYASGRSSMEITCKVSKARAEGEPTKPEDVLLTCKFTMVALDPETRKPANVPKLVYTTPEEEKTFKTGEAMSQSKRQALKASLLQSEPNDPESALIHRTWLRQLSYHDPNNSLRQPENVVSMAKTQLSTAAIMQPQYRNRHQTMIFGGFHLKQTFELAFCCAASFAHARPTFISADPCTFRNPVPVGSVLYLTATVAYTDPPLLEEDGSEPQHADPDKPMTRVHVRVDSKVRDVEHGVAKPTGQFNYTFSVPKDLKVLPHTYEEYMIYVDARRRVKLGDIQRKEELLTSLNEGSDTDKNVNLIE
ncbi:HotDog domain-containing protein [Dactylonectria estremocensis]|uniref:HotDog domain-containing protein n=1 Tax=Dactylonectria estremocensis TaxID=1079267 RepID=A0A9P9IIP1_9HYPO|nr:HotDog domain-containing protein [Dactylonectria estremocensis]